ncbi:shikimate O-hydroxycinnamoyltransferase [Acrasis kona]|uniref:Shikimate O-hydroxycinnamoyltransferase n=1 Tax=Acrasis kona TaxID=1008807 RepID=A0AAW2ZG80_9EUKA
MHTNQSKENFLKLSSSQVALEAPSQEQIKLSVMDNTVSEGITVHFYFCYDNPNQDVNFMEPEAMRESLSKLLGDYPWIGGALTVDDGGKYTINLNGYGVQFDIVRVDAPLNQFKFGSSDEFQKENLCSHWTGLSPCQIQLTYFVCGGVVLSAEFDHRLLICMLLVSEEVRSMLVRFRLYGRVYLECMRARRKEMLKLEFV